MEDTVPSPKELKLERGFYLSCLGEIKKELDDVVYEIEKLEKAIRIHYTGIEEDDD